VGLVPGLAQIFGIRYAGAMRAITDRRDIADAYQRFAHLMSDGGRPLERMVGYKGSSEAAHVLWHPDLQIWTLFQPERIANRYWCAFGVEDPHPASMLSITCEINPPKEGIDRRCAGLFVRDDDGSLHLAHSGKVGGGRRGIGKRAFLRHWGHDDVAAVSFPDGEERDYIILGRFDEAILRARLAQFIHEVSRFKEAAAGAA
jgi:hypothetical protein